MNKLLTTISSFALAASAVTAPVAAEQGDLLVRLRGINVSPSESAEISAIGGTADINSDTVPELDFTYFLTDKVAMELILATSKHSPSAVNTAVGDVPLGSVWVLPPTLTVQYHPMAGEKFSPYVGVGLNYTMFYKSKEPTSVVNSISYKNSFGLAAQAGFDYWVDEDWFINVDVKKISMGSDLTIDTVLGGVTADVDINPWVFGVGFGKKF